MEDNEPRNESVMDGVFDEIASQNHETYTRQGTPDKAEKDPAATGSDGQQNTKTTNTKTDEAKEEPAGDNSEGLDTQDFSREAKTAQADTPEKADEAKEEPLQENNTAIEDIDWKKNVPLPPAKFDLEPPKPDENGLIDPAAYGDYLLARADHNSQMRDYHQKVENLALDAAEKILPEIKTNPAIRQMVENARVASVLNGEQVDTYEAAKQVKEALGLSQSRLNEAKAEGAQNAKTSITIQKNATVETGSSQKREDTSKSDLFEKRLKRGDTSAHEELMLQWMEEGKV